MCKAEIASDSQWTQSINSFQTICWHPIKWYIWDFCDNILEIKNIEGYVTILLPTRWNSSHSIIFTLHHQNVCWLQFCPESVNGVAKISPRMSHVNFYSNQQFPSLSHCNSSVVTDNATYSPHITFIYWLNITCLMPPLVIHVPITLTSAKVHMCMYSWWLTYPMEQHPSWEANHSQLVKKSPHFMEPEGSLNNPLNAS